MSQATAICVWGDGAVGKTCFLIGLTTNAFPTEYIPTTFDQYELTEYDIRGYGKAHLQVFDYVDRSGDHVMFRLHAYHTKGFLLCYDISRPASLESIITTWVPMIKAHCANIPFILVGTKEDLRTSSDPKIQPNIIPLSRGEQVAKEIGAQEHMTCSALQGRNLREIFDCIAAHADRYAKNGLFGTARIKNAKSNRCTLS